MGKSHEHQPPRRGQEFQLELHTQVLHEEVRLRKMHTHGADHFLQALNKGLPQMGDEDLDGYTREAGAQASMRRNRNSRRWIKATFRQASWPRIRGARPIGGGQPFEIP
jgi:hypothetical protein